MGEMSTFLRPAGEGDAPQTPRSDSPGEAVAPQNALRQASSLQVTASKLASVLPFAIVGGLLYAGFFIKPQANGVSVKPPVLEKRDRFYGLASPGMGVLWAAGNHGKIVYSADGGKSWLAQPSGVPAHLQGIAAWDARHAVAVGNGGTVVITADGGATWVAGKVPAETGTAKLLRVRVLTGGRAWAVGEMGTVLTSHDYGATWTAAARSEDMAWNDVYFVGDSGWLVGEFGRMRVSRDGGRTWSPVESPVKSSLSSIVFRNEREGVAVGTEGVIIHTRNGGADWEVLPKLSAEHLYDVSWDGSRWIAVGDKGTLLATAGPTDSWTDVSSAIGNSAWHTQIVGGDGRYVLAGVGLKAIDIPPARN